MNQSNRGAQHYPQRERISRIRELVRRHWGKIAIAGVAAAALGGKPMYHYYRAQTIPRGMVAITYHATIEDGRRVASELRKAIRERKIAAVAVESAFATESNNLLRSQDIAAVRVMADQWRRQGMSEPEMRTKLESEFQWSGINPAFSPIYAEAVVQRIPIRLLENMSETQSAQLKQIFAQQLEFMKKIEKSTTLEEARKNMEMVDKFEAQTVQPRDTEMKEELKKTREEFRKKGEVFAVVGEKHFDVANGNRLEQVDLANRERNYYRLDARLEHAMEPSLRNIRNTILYHLSHAGHKSSPAQEAIVRKAAMKARNLTPEMYTMLNQKFGNLPFLERAKRIAEELSK